MAANPFSSSPYADASSEFADTPPVKRPVSRGMAPTADDITKRAQELGVDPKLALSFFGQESSSNWDSKDSPKGAKGGMQVMPETYRSMMGTTAGQENPWNNLEAGLRYIQYGQRVLGTRDPALLAAGYHAGYDRKSLKSGVIPATNDGSISTLDYARSVANRVREGSKVRFDQSTSPKAQSAADEFADTPPVLGQNEFADTPPNLPGSQQSIQSSAPVDPFTQAEIDNQPYVPRLIGETKEGFGDTSRALTASRWALGGGDSQALADDMANAMQAQSAKPQTTDQKEGNAVYDKVTNAQGVVDTTIAGAKALWFSLTHPKETSIEIARSAANALPTIVSGTVGAGVGAATGGALGSAAGGLGAVPGAIGGAIWGGRAGMVAGTAATELGSEIQDMVQKKLAEDNQPPTSQNVLAILSNPEFQAQALKQGTIKGLTVAAVDQIFMGLGGKIATAPARAIASKELADQGVDMATRSARRAALASPAGVAALQAAKPSMGAKAKSHLAALGVNAGGESIGEGWSQYNARGNVDYGDALREGVVSIGQSAVETVAGSTMAHAKLAASSAAASVGLTPVTVAPSTASGPLARAVENAAAEPERVTVTAPDGQVSGTVVAHGPNVAKIVGDDGQVYNFHTGPGGVKIEPEAPNTPLSNALEVAADEHASKSEQTPAQQPAIEQPAPEAPKAESDAAAVVVPSQTATLSEMSDQDLRARLKYIAAQAKTNGGWDKMMAQQRRLIEREINSRAPAIEADVLAPAKGKKASKAQELVPIANKPVPKPATPALEAPKVSIPPELASMKPRIALGKKAFELKFSSDFDKAAYIAFSAGNQQRTAYLPQIMQATGMNADQVREHGSKVDAAITAMAKDASPGTLKVPEVSAAPSTTSDSKYHVVAINERTGKKDQLTGYPESHDKAMAIKSKQTPHEAVRYQLEESVPASTSMKQEPVQPAVATPSKASAAAIDRIAKGTAYFGTKEKAQAFIDKNGLTDTHTIAQTGKVRFDVRAKGEDVAVKKPVEVATEAAHKVMTAGGTEAQANRAATDALIEGMATSPEINIAEAAPAAVKAAKDQIISKEPTNVTGTHTGRQPAGAEAVGQEAHAGQAKAAAVQPAATQKVAPGTRFNGATERAAADRLEKLYEQMGNITGRYSREGHAKAAVRSVIEELRKPKTVTGVEAVLEKASSDLMRSYGAFADVIGDVAEALRGKPSNLSKNAPEMSTSPERVQETAKTEHVSPALAKYDAAVAKHDDLVMQMRAATARGDYDQADKISQSAMPLSNEIRRLSMKVQDEQIKQGAENHRAEEEQKFAGMPVGTIMRPTEHDESKGLFWEKTATNEWTGQGDWFQNGKKRTDADQAEFGGLMPMATKPATKKRLGDQLAELNAELERQGPVKNANTVAKRDALRKENAEENFPGIFKAVDGNLGTAEELNLAFMFAGDEPKAKTIARVLKKRGITQEYQDRWTDRLMSELSNTTIDIKPSQFANNKIFTADAVAKARARMKSKLGQLNSGLDPELVMDGMTIAGAYIESGVRSFADYAKAMTDDFGPKIKPFLLSFYEAARHYPGLETTGMTSPEATKAQFDALNAKEDQLQRPEENPSDKWLYEEDELNSWFGNSQVVGADGRPLTVYHTTYKVMDKAIESFDRNHLTTKNPETGRRQKSPSIDSIGTWFSDNPGKTDAYGVGAQYPAHLKITKPKVYPTFDHLRAAWEKFHGDGASNEGRALHDKNTFLGDADGFVTNLKGQGFDGVIIPTHGKKAGNDGIVSTEFKEQSAYLVFDSNQVRSVFDRRAGTETQGNDHGPQKLDQSGAGKLASQQPTPVQGTEPQRQAGNGAEGRSGTNVLGGERSGEVRVQPTGSVGNDAGKVPADSARGNAGRGVEQGGSPVQRGQRAAKPDPAKRESGNQPDLTPETGTRAQDRADDAFTITDEDAIGEGGAKTKFKQNVEAIKLLAQLTSENRQATRAEQAVLAKYVGWGGIPQAFGRDNGEVSKGWEKEVAELRSVLTTEELAAAAASTRNAHYTSTEIVSAVWDAVKHFGFQGGRVLEPSVGVGNFFGLMPASLRSASQLTGVELDRVTGGIAKQLYPQANIQAPVGFQDFSAPDNYFDLAIGNPPFGREGIYDSNRRKISGFSIHNYFFAKSIDTVKPNGVLAMVVTNRLLDSAGDKARNYIADRAEFLGAIRLPNNAFAKNAGTEVTTDIIFLRKRKDGESASTTAQPWMNVKQITDANGVQVPLNEYFVKHPEMMLGMFGAYGSMYSPTDAALVAKPGQDTPAMMRTAMASLPKGFMDAPTAAPALETIEPMHDIAHVKVGSVFEQGGKIFERSEDMLGKQQAKPVVFSSEKAQERVTGMIAVRDALVDVRGLQLKDGVATKVLEDARAKLNKAYDTFVAANGPINADANKRLMRDDPTWAQLAALEDSFDKGVSAAVAKSTGEKSRPASANKSAIFTKRTQSPYHPPQSASSAKDALVSSLAERGRVDLDYMSGLYGKTPDMIASELDGLIYETMPGDYVSREEYLSGNVKKRLAQAIDLAKKFPRFSKNVEALRAVQPADIEAVDIDVKAGAHWIPADVMQSFTSRISGGQNIKAVYNPVNAMWTLSAERISAAASTEWATDRAGVINVLEAASNQKQIAVYDRNYDDTRTLNEAATTAANEKVAKVKAEWKSWIWSDDARRQRLSRIYNDTFNTDVQREFDGSHLSFPGKVGNDIIQLRPHQANAVWRMVQSGTTLLDHVVGAGKTFTMIAGIMEMRRMGMAKKPMLVVPNHLVGQWSEDFMKLYPVANILAATKKDFEKESRRKLFARISTGDWDAVIVAHSSFGKVEVDPQFQEQFIKQQIDDMDTSIQAMRSAEGKNSRNVKQIEKQKAMLEEKLKKLFDTGSKDDNLYFSELGIDAVLLDEAHAFKNLGFSTSMRLAAGFGNPTGSEKAADMFMKIQSVLKRTGGRNVVFATGTPISNSMTEMYTMQRYLDYGTLKDQGIAHFDAWAKTFGEVVTDWELSPSGQYKMNSRFAKFVNMPELMQRYQSFADVVNRDDINRMLASQGKKLPVPKVATGKPENVIVERSSDQASFIGMPITTENGAESYAEGTLIWRSENLPKKVAKGSDNMLKIMSDARKAALDMRLIDPGYPDNPKSKVNVAARNIKAIYDQSLKDKGTQLVFIDLSTPKGAVAKEAAVLRDLVERASHGDEAAQEKLDAMSPDTLLALDSKFSVYDDLKAKLIASGIPENEVAFIHDAGTEMQKEDLFAKVRSGRMRVLLGSTEKMGAGMNVQDRLVALHHLDAPWRPSDLEQREGRIIRQGNKLYDANPDGFEVRILRYATKQTLDSRMWQTIEGKARFIEQVRKGVGTEREVEDVAGEAANSAEMKAASSGNPLILEEMSLRQSIRKLDNQKSEHEREQHRIKDRMRMAEETASRYESNALSIAKDAKLAPVGFEVQTNDGQIFDKHKDAGEAIMLAVDAMLKASEESRDIGTYGGFKLTADNTSSGMDHGRAVLTIAGSTTYQIEANAGSNPTGLALRLQNTVKNLAHDAALAKESAERNRSDIPKLKAQIKPWGMETELATAKSRHTEVIDQLKPKKKEAAAPSAQALEAIFAGLEQEGGSARKQADAALSAHPNAETIRAIDTHFWDILSDLEEQNKVSIKC